MKTSVVCAVGSWPLICETPMLTQHQPRMDTQTHKQLKVGGTPLQGQGQTHRSAVLTGGQREGDQLKPLILKLTDHQYYKRETGGSNSKPFSHTTLKIRFTELLRHTNTSLIYSPSNTAGHHILLQGPLLLWRGLPWTHISLNCPLVCFFSLLDLSDLSA